MKFFSAAVGTLLLVAGSAVSIAAETKSEATDAKSTEQRLEDAHKRLEQAAREIAELSGKVTMDRMPDNLFFLGHSPNRAMLGIGIGASKETEIDEGVAVVSVSPGGAAAGAGLKTGDVIVELNGKSLKRDKEDSPREKLLGAMSKLSPGDEVTLRYLREGKASIVKLKAERLPQEFARREVRVQGIPGERFRFDKDDFNFDFDAPHMLSMMRGGSFGDMELVPLTPKLSPYFGTDKGLLIVRAPQGKDLKLEDGDVIVDIDGRIPANPGHAFRILASYQGGEKVTLNILRQRKKTSLAIVIPERDEHGPRVHKERIERVERMPPVKAPPPPLPPV